MVSLFEIPIREEEVHEPTPNDISRPFRVVSWIALVRKRNHETN